MARTLVIGDIHGCLTALELLAGRVGLQPGDRLVTLGDYVDRGPDSRGVIDWLLAYGRRGRNLVTLRGNHEIMMMDARHDADARRSWLGYGGRQTVRSYSPDGGEGDLDDVPEEHWNFLEATVPYLETDSHLLVHANLYPELELVEQPDSMLFWEKLDSTVIPHCTGKTMVCGHTAQSSGLPLDLGAAICIDTKAYSKRGWLTCLELETRCYWQANQRGQSLEGVLGDWEAR